MWLQILLAVCFRTFHFSPHQGTKQKLFKFVIGAAADQMLNLHDALTKVLGSLQKCMGDHSQMFPFPNQSDLNSIETIKEMLHANRTNSELNDIYDLVRFIVSQAKPSASPETVDQKFIKKVFRNITMRLREIDQTNLSANRWKCVRFEQYGRKRKSIKSLRRHFATWIASPNDLCKYNVFVTSCVVNNMNILFSVLNETINDDIETPGFPEVQLGNLRRNRANFTRMARLIKSDMCEEIVLLAACDQVLRTSDDTLKRNLAKAVAVYKQFADGFREMDKDLVTNARNDITLDIKNLTTNGMKQLFPYFGYIPSAEILRSILKQKYYWLDFTAILMDAGFIRDGGRDVSEYFVGGATCVIATMQNIGDELWRVMVFMSGRSPKNDSEGNAWSIVETAVNECAQEENWCRAEVAVGNTTNMNGGIPVLSYFAIHRYKLPVSGPAGTTGRENVRMFQIVETGHILVRVHAAIACEDEIYEY